jgi:hypothetical protein
MVCLSLASVALAGCNRYPDRAAVSGEIKFAGGQPIVSGVIEFSALDDALVSGAPIVTGKYYVPRDKGLKPGKYRVRINAPDSGGVAPSGAPGQTMPATAALARELVPPKYNLESKIEVKVANTDNQVFNFTIETN